MKLIVGLGNPGKEYEHTRHNMGFDFLDFYLDKIGESNVNWSNKFNGLYYQTNIKGEKVIFLKPQSYMNLSGGVVRKYLDFFKIDTKDLLVVSDDLDLSVGNFKIRENGSCGGHNGLRDIERNIGTQEYKRFKIGISNTKDVDTKDYVLGRISKEDMDKIKGVYADLVNVLNDYFTVEFSKLMSLYNRKNR